MAELPAETYAKYAYLAQRYLEGDDIGAMSAQDLRTSEVCIYHARMRLDANLKAIRLESRHREAAIRRAEKLKEKVAKSKEQMRDKAARAEERIREAAEKHRTKIAEKKRKPSRSPPQA